MPAQLQNTSHSILDELDPSGVLAQLFQHPDHLVAVTDETGHIILRNKRMEKHFSAEKNKFSHFSLIGRLTDATCEDDNTLTIDLADKKCHFCFYPVSSNTNEIYYFWLGSIREDAALRRNMSILKNLYRSFVDTSFELIFRTDLSGKILFANRSFGKVFEITNYRKLRGTDVSRFFADGFQYRDLMTRAAAGKQLKGEVIAFKKSNHEPLTGLVNCHVQNDAFNERVINFTVLDITRQVESEQALKANNQQLEKVNQQMEKFLYSTSHDLRSPISSILGLVNLMRMEGPDPAIADYATKIEACANKLDSIIRDIMDFSRTRYQHKTSERINFELLTRNTYVKYKTDPAAKNIHFEVKADQTTPFFCDPGRIEIIIDNIIRNSINFSDANKARPFILLNIRTAKDHVNIECIDNGIGIGKNHIESIFNMFYKASHVSRGAGLGLFIVKEALTDLNGTVSVESEVGFGTVIRMRIPNDNKGLLINRKLALIGR